MPVPDLTAFLDELEKIGGVSPKERRHKYYLENRQRILQRSREYRRAHAAQIRLRQRRYNRKVKHGARVRRRQHMGFGYKNVGFH